MDGNNVTYFDRINIEHVRKEIKIFITNKNKILNILSYAGLPFDNKQIILQ